MSHCAGKHDFGQSLVKTVNTIYPKFWWKVTKRKIIRKYLLSREALSIHVLTIQLIIAENSGHFCAMIITFVRKGRHHFSDAFTLEKISDWCDPRLVWFSSIWVQARTSWDQIGLWYCVRATLYLANISEWSSGRTFYNGIYVIYIWKWCQGSILSIPFYKRIKCLIVTPPLVTEWWQKVSMKPLPSVELKRLSNSISMFGRGIDYICTGL